MAKEWNDIKRSTRNARRTSIGEYAALALLIVGAGAVIVLLVLPGMRAKPSYVRVPDTGQSAIFTSIHGEDSDYAINPPSYTDEGDGSVTDNVTGLMWQKDDSGPSAITQIAGRSFCQDLKLAGHTDWRLPTYHELASLLHFGFSSGNRHALPSLFVPGRSAAADRAGYWTSTVLASDSSLAWAFTFWSSRSAAVGHAEPAHRITAGDFAAKCVRGTGMQTKHFLRHGDGTITDDQTGLIWQQEDDGTTRTWEDAIVYCETLELARSNDWRLPTIKELSSIVDTSTHDPAIDIFFFPVATATLTNQWWSSTFNPGNAVYRHVYSLDLYNGEWQPLSDPHALYHVRCVRGGR